VSDFGYSGISVGWDLWRAYKAIRACN